jgi:branched-chain amino acid transport system permease protein
VTPLTSSRARPLLIWGGFSSLLIVAPLIFTQSAALSVLSQIGSMMSFGLSFNMLLGQTGMLSFGHAVFAGLGAFVAVHLMNALSGSSPAWLLLVP